LQGLSLLNRTILLPKANVLSADVIDFKTGQSVDLSANRVAEDIDDWQTGYYLIFDLPLSGVARYPVNGSKDL